MPKVIAGCILGGFLVTPGSASVLLTQLPVVSTLNTPCLNPAQATVARLDQQVCSVSFPTSLTPGLPTSQVSNLPSDSVNVTQGFTQVFTDRINCYYQGHMLASGLSISQCADAPAIFPATPPPSYVCNLNDGEDTQNHLGQSCGQLTNTDDSWRQAQDRGLWVQAVKYFRHQILQVEIMSAGALNIHAACSAPATQFATYISQAQAASQALINSSSSPISASINSLNACALVASTTNSVNSLTPGTVSSAVLPLPVMATCQLAATRDGLLALFEKIAECELETRLLNFWNQYVGGLTRSLATAINNCVTQAVSVGVKKKSESAGTAEFNRCIPNPAHLFYKDIVSTYLPGVYPI